MWEISKTFRFESAHRLPNFPEGHKCRRLHGHSFRVSVVLRGSADNDAGVVLDYGELKRVVQPFVELLDHRYINEIGEETQDALLCNPTSENLARWFYEKIKPELPALDSVVLYETCTTRCVYRPAEI